jgi:hypothetical protein
MNNPFSEEKLLRLFETDPTRPDRLKRRESTTLELKENFSLAPDAKVEYGRTMAAFANRDGGHILFGIKDQPHTMTGMTNDRFETLDPRTLSQFLAEQFSPNIDWQHHVHTIGERRFGLIYVSPAKRKPVVCTKINSKLRDGDIYYRYQGETRLIASAELHGLIQDLIEAERKSWRELLGRTAHTTPSATYLLDTTSGRLRGEKGTFVIGEQLLDKIKFIEEGHFDDGGEAALRVIGDVEVVRTEMVPVPQPVPTDPARTHPLLRMDLIAKINEEFGPGTVNQFDMQCVRAVHNVTARPDWYYLNTIGPHSPRYSLDYMEWLKDQYRRNPDFFTDARRLRNHHN